MEVKNKNEKEKEGFAELIGSSRKLILLVILFLLIYFAFLRWGAIMGFLKKVLKILKPFIFGVIFAYLLNPVFERIRKWVKKLLLRFYKKNEKKADSHSRVISSIFTVILALALIFLLFVLVLPELYESVMSFVTGFSRNVKSVEKRLMEFLEQYPEIEPTVMNYYDSIVSSVQNWISNTVIPGAGQLFTNVTNGLAVMLKLLENIFIGIIVAIYLLNEKEMLLPQIRKTVCGLFSKNKANFILHECAYADEMMDAYVIGKIIDSIIMGLLIFIIGTVIRCPYMVMNSVIVAVFSLIPFFGPWIGGGLSAFIIFILNPVKGIQYLIAYFILLQIDGNLIEPKILGNTTGLSSFWVLFAILFFGGIWGIPGMIIGVPVFAVISHMFVDYINGKLTQKGLPISFTSYEKEPKEGILQRRLQEREAKVRKNENKGEVNNEAN